MGRSVWRLLRMAAPYWRWMALAAMLSVAAIASSIGLMATAAWIIARAALEPSIAVLQPAIVGVRFFGIMRGVLRYLERYVSHEATFRLLARLRVWFYSALEPLAPARLMRYRSGDLLSRSVADIETLEHFYARVITPPVVALVVAALMAVFVGSFHPLLALIVLAFFLAAGIGAPLLTWILSRDADRQRIAARAELNAALVEGVQGLADLIAFGQQARRLDNVRALSATLVRRQQRLAQVNGFQNALLSLLVWLAVVAVLAAAIPRVDPLYLAPLALAALASFEAIFPLPAAFQQLGSSLKAAERLFEIIDARPEVIEPDAPSPPPRGYRLEVHNVRFRYGPDEPLALDNVNFTLAEGRRLALVGPSGAGKTTLVNLLLRFWEIQEGEIKLGGRRIQDFHSDDLRGMIGVVAQDTILFNATIRQNLLLARPQAAEEEIVYAAQQAQLHDFVLSLPQGYETWIGEQGLRLSGGERQRLAIARALLKNAPLLVLDEATANLDAETERQVMQAILKLMEGRTTLMITHRLILAALADEIVVLHRGQVAEQGRYDELMQTQGLYYRLWMRQAEALTP